MELLNELTQTKSVLWEGKIEGDHYEIHEDIVDGISNLTFVAEGTLVRAVSRAAKKNPLTTAIIGLSLAGMAAKAYKRNKRHTTHFFTKSIHERKMYRAIVKTLINAGGYTVKHNEKYTDGGYLWTLKKAR